jgi:hypothetical protein
VLFRSLRSPRSSGCLLVLHGAAAGVTLFVAMLVFIVACMYALRSEDPADVKHNERTGLAGWIGGGF